MSSFIAQGQPEPWNIHAAPNGYVIRFHGEIVAEAETFGEVRATYNTLRAHSLMALESLRWVLGSEAA